MSASGATSAGHSQRTTPASGAPAGPGSRTYHECRVHDVPMVKAGVRSPGAERGEHGRGVAGEVGGVVGLDHADRVGEVLAAPQRTVDHHAAPTSAPARPLGGGPLGGAHALLERQRQHLGRARPGHAGAVGAVRRDEVGGVAAGREQAPPDLDGAEAGARPARSARRRPPTRRTGRARRPAARVVVGPHPDPGVDPAHAVDEHARRRASTCPAPAAAAPTPRAPPRRRGSTSAVGSARPSPSPGVAVRRVPRVDDDAHHATTRSTVAVRGPLRTT